MMNDPSSQLALKTIDNTLYIVDSVNGEIVDQAKSNDAINYQNYQQSVLTTKTKFNRDLAIELYQKALATEIKHYQSIVAAKDSEINRQHHTINRLIDTIQYRPPAYHISLFVGIVGIIAFTIGSIGLLIKLNSQPYQPIRYEKLYQ